MIRCAFLEMKRLPSNCTPRRTSASISSISEPGSTTTPQPITQRHPGCRMPDGIVCRTYFSRPTTTVWPALLPPAKRATTFTCGARRSTTLPLPSSPHCVPTTTMLGMAHTSEYMVWMLEDFTNRQHALRRVREVYRQDLTSAGPRVTDHEDVAHALGAGVGDRLLELAADDVAGDRGAQVAEPARQRERHRLVRREVDDEEVGPGQRHRDALGLHDGQRASDIEREPDGRTIVPETPEHVVVAAAARDRGAEPRDVGLEVRARVIVESADFPQVEQHALGEPVDLEQPIRLGEVGKGFRRPLVPREPGGALQH